MFVDAEERVSKDNSLWTIKTVAEEAQEHSSPEIVRKYAPQGFSLRQVMSEAAGAWKMQS